MSLLKNTFQDKTVLVTGHTGFKGSWLSIWLMALGARVIGCSLNIPTNPSNFQVSKLDEHIDDNRIDIRELNSLSILIEKNKPDFIFHLAAQSLVLPSYENPLDTFSINAMGSINLLESLRNLDKKLVVVMITSDKVYDNLEWSKGYSETDRIGGKDPYSASKGMAELAIRSYFESYLKADLANVNLGIARAGNVIGGGDWAKDRIIPDCIRAWSREKTVDIRNPASTRPWQHVLEPLSGYLLLASNLLNSNQYNGEAYNFGPSSDNNFSVGELLEEVNKTWEKAEWNDVSGKDNQPYEAGLLKLNCDKAHEDLGWHPTLDFEQTIKMTIEWYLNYLKSDQNNMYHFSISQIEDYVKLAQKKSIPWSL